MVSNWNNRKLDDVEVKIDLAKLGLAPGRLRVRRALEHPIVNHIHRMRKQVPTYKPRDIRYSKNGIINVELQPRNLEVIELETTE